MNAKPFRFAVTAVLLGLAAPGLAQTTTDNPSSTPLGKGAGPDGTKPSDGAIKGGSIVPGETAGVPTDRQVSRCADLTGTLREQCLADEKGGSTGGTAAPDADVAKPPTTREGPPPQNPQPSTN
ncbi:MAG TPA: hypothetical protein VGF58_01150 [Burkholderiales bacterium]|jgi:hypothetical protein